MLQDRLVKNLRLQGISTTVDAANESMPSLIEDYVAQVLHAGR